MEELLKLKKRDYNTKGTVDSPLFLKHYILTFLIFNFREMKCVKKKSEFREWVQAIFFAVVISLVIRTFLFETTLVYGKSMEPTLHHRDRVIINKIVYTIGLPSKGEIIVFKNPDNIKENYVKRIIAVEGDIIRIEDGNVYVNDELLDEPYIPEIQTDNFDAVKVPKDTIFVMGDNRNNSQDSRSQSVGFVPLKNIIGRAQIRIWPIADIKYFK